jgi:hypothetical protein
MASMKQRNAARKNVKGGVGCKKKTHNRTFAEICTDRAGEEPRLWLKAETLRCS